MGMLTIRQLRYFEALREVRHFGRAARRLHITQPALSAQIQQMEEFFGGPLFERGPAGISLTRDGEAIAKRVRRILEEIDDLEALASHNSGLMSGRFSLGIIATVAPYMIPRFLSLLEREHPDAACAIREGTTERLIRDVLSGEIDGAVVALPIAEARVEVMPLFDDPFRFATAAGAAEAYGERMRVESLAGETLILLEEGHCLREQALQICRIADPQRMTGLGATSLPTVLRMVAGGLGTTLIPELAVEDEMRRGDIAVIPFEAPTPFRTIALAFRPTTAQRPDFEALGEIIRRAASASAP